MAEHIEFASEGNHEFSIRERAGTCMLTRVAERLSNKNHRVRVGAYHGWVVFLFTIGGTTRYSLRMWYHHGFGGGGPVTKGAIQTNRMAAQIDRADFVYSGHTHDDWIFTVPRHGISDSHKPYSDGKTVYMRAPGYKDEFGPSDGWHVRRGGGPKTQGSIWLTFRPKKQGNAYVVKPEIMRAD